MRLRFDRFPSPAGELACAVDERGALVRLAFLDVRSERERAVGWAPADAKLVRDAAACAGVRTQLEEYFDGARRDFELELALAGSPFQLRVWEELQRIPYGRTASYGEVAARVGSPGASRAVGRANHENPIPIVVPCHRVVGADGRLVGFGGGLAAKRVLLDLERHAAPQRELFSA